jgi:hypothetical protein
MPTRRETDGEQLNPHVRDLLIEGWAGPAREYPGYDAFDVFDLGAAELRALAEAHRGELNAEAQRRGVPGGPWCFRTPSLGVS